MSSRDNRSGAQKRKKRVVSVIKHHELMAKVPKLATFFRRTPVAADSRQKDSDSGNRNHHIFM